MKTNEQLDRSQGWPQAHTVVAGLVMEGPAEPDLAGRGAWPGRQGDREREGSFVYREGGDSLTSITRVVTPRGA